MFTVSNLEAIADFIEKFGRDVFDYVADYETELFENLEPWHVAQCMTLHENMTEKELCEYYGYEDMDELNENMFVLYDAALGENNYLVIE